MLYNIARIGDANKKYEGVEITGSSPYKVNLKYIDWRVSKTIVWYQYKTFDRNRKLNSIPNRVFLIQLFHNYNFYMLHSCLYSWTCSFKHDTIGYRQEAASRTLCNVCTGNASAVPWLRVDNQRRDCSNTGTRRQVRPTGPEIPNNAACRRDGPKELLTKVRDGRKESER